MKNYVIPLPRGFADSSILQVMRLYVECWWGRERVKYLGDGGRWGEKTNRKEILSLKIVGNYNYLKKTMWSRNSSTNAIIITSFRSARWSEVAVYTVHHVYKQIHRSDYESEIHSTRAAEVWHWETNQTHEQHQDKEMKIKALKSLNSLVYISNK